MMSTRHALTVLLLSSSVTLAACGGSEPPARDAASSPAPAAGPAAPAAAAPDRPAVHDGRKVEITANDAIKFSVVEVRAKPGERLSVTLSNTGTMPKFSMGHNWVLLALGTDIEAFLSAAGEAPTTDYVPAGKRSEILAATKLLGPGEQDTVTFDAPSAPGSYPFLCSFPGHAQVGMRGVLIVE